MCRPLKISAGGTLIFWYGMRAFRDAHSNLYGKHAQMALYILGALLVVALAAFIIGRARAISIAGREISSLHSRPTYHGGFLAIWASVPAFLATILLASLSGRYVENAVLDKFSDTLSSIGSAQTQAFLRDVRSLAETAGETGRQVILSTKGELREQAELAAELYTSQISTVNVAMLVLSVILVLAGGVYGYTRIRVEKRNRHFVEKFITGILVICSAVAILTTIGIVFSLIFESIRFFQKVPFFDFLFGYHWSPQSAFENASGTSLAGDNSRIFGAIPLFVGTFLITFIAISIAAPLGLMSAIYMSDYASQRFRAIAKPVMEILAGIPTVVYGFFAALTVAPAIRGWGEAVGLSVSSESALAAGVVMGIMIIPFVMSLSDDVINSVPQSLRDGSYAMGATRSETIRRVVLPAALPGIVSALLLAVSRAVGETMIVVMAAGLAANLTINPLEAVTTVTVQIVTLLVGDQEFDSAKTLAAFALGLVLFVITLCLNVYALYVVKKYREQYD